MGGLFLFAVFLCDDQCSHKGFFQSFCGLWHGSTCSSIFFRIVAKSLCYMLAEAKEFGLPSGFQLVI